MTPRLFAPDDPGVAAAWAALLARSASAPPHAALAFVQAVAAEIGARVRVLAVEAASQTDTESSATPAPAVLSVSRLPPAFSAGVLVCEKRRGPWRCAVQPPLAYYHAPVFAAAPRTVDVEARTSPLDALAAALTDRYDAVALALPPAPDGILPDVRPLTWRGFTCEVRYAYRLPLGPPDVLRAQMRPHTRRLLPAQPDAPGPATPETLAAQVTASYARHGARPPLPEAALARVARVCVASGAGRLCAVGEAVALVLHGAGIPFEVLAGSPPGPHHTRLVWALASALHAGGGDTLDLGGANTPSIAAHKRRLGAHLVPFVRATWHRPGVPRLVAALRPLV